MIHKLQIIAKCAKHIMSKKLCVIALVILSLIFMMFYTGTLSDSKFKILWDKYEDDKISVSKTTTPSASSSKNAQKCIDFFSNMAKNIYGASKNELKQIANLCEKIILPKFQTPKNLEEEQHDAPPQVVVD